MGLLRPSQLSVFCSAGQRCMGDRSSFCRLEALKRHCSLPDFQRMCCKSCRDATVSSGGFVPIRHRVTSPPTSTSSISRSFTSVHTTVSPWTVSHSNGPHSTPPLLTSTQMTTTTASISTSVLSIAFSTPGSPDMTTSQPLPAPDTDVNTDLQSNTVSPTTSGVVITTFTPAVTDRSPAESKSKKNNPQKKKTNYVMPPKTNAKKNNAPKNTTRKDLPKTNAKKKTNDLPRNSDREETATIKTQATPKKSTSENATPKKSNPNKPVPKKTPPKTKPRKPAQPKTNRPKNPKSAFKKLQNPQVRFNQTHRRNETFETTTLSYHILASSLKPDKTTELLSSTIPSSTGVPQTTDSSKDPTTRAHTPQWYLDAATATPSNFDDSTPTQSTPLEDVSSRTTPYSTSGDIPVTSGAISGDDMTVSFINVGVVSNSMVLDDGLTMVIPTINSEDLTDVTSSPWLDQSEFIPVNVPVPMSLSEQTTVTPAMEKHTVDPLTQRPQRRPDESNDNNLVDVYNKNTGVDGNVPQNNQIAKHRVNLRERTKNKRIQELLEEKRNFLLRMKRGQAA